MMNIYSKHCSIELKQHIYLLIALLKNKTSSKEFVHSSVLQHPTNFMMELTTVRNMFVCKLCCLVVNANSCSKSSLKRLIYSGELPRLAMVTDSVYASIRWHLFYSFLCSLWYLMVGMATITATFVYVTSCMSPIKRGWKLNTEQISNILNSQVLQLLLYTWVVFY